MSTLTEQGVMEVKQVACDRLLASRVEAKLQVCFRAMPHQLLNLIFELQSSSTDWASLERKIMGLQLMLCVCCTMAGPTGNTAVQTIWALAAQAL